MNITDLMSEVQQDLRSGGRARRDLSGSKTPVWEALTEVFGAGRQFDVATTDAMDFPAIEVKDSPTPAGKVATDTPKPEAVTISQSNVSLAAYAGKATLDTRTVLGSANLAGTIVAVLRRQGAQAFEADVAAALATTDNAAATGDTIVEAIAAGQAALLALGGTPDVLVVNGASYGALVGSTNIDQTDGQLQVLGSSIYVNNSVTSAYVADRSSLTLVAHSSGVVVDAASDVAGAATNKVVVLAESFLAAVRGNDGIVPVTFPTPV